jgi:predicted MPP superfamily phosphohydrolase
MLKLALTVVVLAVALVAIWHGNNMVEVTRYRVELSDPPSPVESEAKPAGLRILQISDLHGKRFGRGSQRLLDEIDRLDYDIIAITGDIITGGPLARGRRTALQLAAELVERAPVFYTPGNHETTSRQFAGLEDGLRDLGVHVLRRDSVEIDIRGRRYVILGLDDVKFFDMDPEAYSAALSELVNLAPGQSSVPGGAARLCGAAPEPATSQRTDGAAGRAQSSVPRILVSHRPNLLDIYAASGVQLVLTGHVHGGQFRIPGVGGLIGPDDLLLPKYDAGVFRKGETTMIVSRGLGPSAIPVRINNRPELVLIEIA